MWRTHNCGELRISNKDEQVTLSGWIQRIRDKGSVMWIDLRDRYGITQLIIEEANISKEILEKARSLNREFVVQVKGKVIERQNPNPNLPTGEIEIIPEEISVLNESKLPPFTIEDNTDGGDELRMKYRFLDLRRNEVKEKIVLRHNLLQKTRNYLSDGGFIEVETPVLIKSTPEGARDFVVPSRMNPGEFYALPQSPQTFKQLLMVSGFDKYFQIVKCFRDEDLRADRQPEFTQIDCEMSYVEQEDILNTFEELIRYLIKEIKGVELGKFDRLTYAKAMELYGSDKPDIRFEMILQDVRESTQGKGFNVFDQAESIIGFKADGCADFSRKQLDALTNWVRRPQIGAKGLVYVKVNEDGTFKSSIDKFFTQDDQKALAQNMGAKPGDLILIISGEENQTRNAIAELRLHVAEGLGLRNPEVFQPLWVTDFPLLEWDEDSQRFHAMHHPFTSPRKEDIELLKSEPGKVRANAYDMVINGVEIGGGSIRIHKRDTQQIMFDALGFTKEEAENQFGFLLNAFEYGAPPHGGIAFGFDRLCSLLGGSDSIRDYIAFPKNNNGRDLMIDSPSPLETEQLNELKLKLNKSE